jgi:type I restriction enzyme S subunit
MAQFETSTINQLTQSDLNNLDIPVPSELERSNIIDFLQRSTQEIDTTIAKLKHEISLLSEYYTRLVSDIVTGKLDVREAAANLPNEDTDGGNSP